MVVVEIAGAFFGIFMLFITYISFRKKQLNKNDMLVWGAIWVLVIAFSLLSQQLQDSVRLIGFIRLLDFVLIAGLAVLSGIIFFQFRKIRVLERKFEELLEKIMHRKK